MRKEHYTCDAGALSIGTFIDYGGNKDFLLSRHEILNGYGDGTHTVFVLGEDENFPPQNSKIDGGWKFIGVFYVSTNKTCYTLQHDCGSKKGLELGKGRYGIYQSYDNDSGDMMLALWED